MKTWIALLRGINVGGRHVVPMRELRAALEDSGFGKVRTYIQSGNLVFDHATKPGQEIADLIEREFGFRPEVFVMSGSDLGKAIANNPYRGAGGSTVHFFFCDKAPKSVDYDLLDTLKIGSERYELVGKVFYLHAPDGIGRSILVQKLGKAIPGVTMTARNLNTISKLAAMLGD